MTKWGGRAHVLRTAEIVAVRVLKEPLPLRDSPLAVIPRIRLPVHIRLDVVERVIKFKLRKASLVLLLPPLETQ